MTEVEKLQSDASQKRTQAAQLIKEAEFMEQKAKEAQKALDEAQRKASGFPF